MINFIEFDRRIRFQVSLTATRRVGLDISSRLLAVAFGVEDHRPCSGAASAGPPLDASAGCPQRDRTDAREARRPAFALCAEEPLFRRRFLSLLFCLVIAAACGYRPAPVFGQNVSPVELLAEMSLEELAQIEVFSASRQLEPTRGVPSAIFVLTGDDLRRSGVTNLADALRLVPGVQVGRVDANKWAVSMRGFNAREANKLLVLVDGRSIYDPLFSGMLWESHDFVLEDIQRIEVIRGPGGALWGANAFNGVINIITQHAGATNGTYVSFTTGDEERHIAAFRHGWEISEGQNARVYLKARERDTGFSAQSPPFDALEDVRAGFRWDLGNGSSRNLRVSGDVFDADAGIRENANLAHTVEHRGRNLLTQWYRQLGRGNDLRLQFYYDHVDYDSVGFRQERETYDLEFQQNVDAGERHAIVWGVGLTRIRDAAASKLSGFVDVLPARRDDAVKTVFVQDTIAVNPDTLNLVLGVKYEATDYADAKVLPNVRLAWSPRYNHTTWAAISEAIRVPSRLEADLTFFNTLRIGDAFEAEEVRAYEVGHRRLVSSSLWYDVAIFHNDYESLRSTEADGTLGNLMQGHTTGLELALRWEPLSRFRMDASYTYLDMDLALAPESTSGAGQVRLHEGLYSRHQLALRNIVRLRRDLDLDAVVRYADELPAIGVPAYTQLDLALSWRPRPAWEFSVVGSNLLNAHQPEQDFAFSAGGLPTEVERSFYVKASWRR